MRYGTAFGARFRVSQDLAILEAAFALRESGTASPGASQTLHDVLPAALCDVPADNRSTLSAAVLRQLVADPHAMAFLAAHIGGQGTTYKSFTPTIESVPASASVYVCPIDGAYTWLRPDATYPIPDCPDHPGTKLVPKQAR